MTAATLDKSAKKGLAGVVPKKAQISVGLGTCGIGNGALELFEALKTAAAETGVNITRTGCFGFCAEEPLLMIYTPETRFFFYAGCCEICEIYHCRPTPSAHLLT